jgi:hypothetical protein
MAGVDIRTVQELMGHKTITMTLRYSHLPPQHHLAAVQKLCETVSTQKSAPDSRTDSSVDEGLVGRDLLSTKTIHFLLLVPVAGMAKLADAADLKSAGAKSPVGVRFPLPAPTNPLTRRQLGKNCSSGITQFRCTIFGQFFRNCVGTDFPQRQRIFAEQLLHYCHVTLLLRF